MIRNLGEQPLRIGILGCGGFMQRRILTALPEAPAARVVNIHKRVRAEAQDVAERFKIPRVSTTREELLADREVEAVYIGTLNTLHEADALACAEAGKHVLCEKPLATTAKAAERMVEAFQRTNLTFLVAHCLRFKGAIRQARDILASGQLGELRGMHAYYSIPYTPLDNWRFDSRLGGGVAMDIGVHLIDLMRYIAGQAIVAVTAMADPHFHPSIGQADRTARAVFRFASGATASLEVSFEEAYRHGFEVMGTRAALVSSGSLRQSPDSGESLRIVRDDGAVEQRIFPENVYAAQLNHFALVVCGGETPIIPGSEGLANQQVLDALYRSIIERREVDVEQGQNAGQRDLKSEI